MTEALRTSWQGHYFDGRTTARHPVTVFLAPSGLELTKADGTRLWWPYGEIVQAQGAYEHEPVRLERGEPIPEAVVVDDPAFLSAMRRISKGHAAPVALPQDRASRLKTVLLACAATVALIAAVVAWGIPAMGELLTPFIPTSWEVALGKSVVPQLAPSRLQCTDARLRASVDALVGRLAAAGPPSPYSFHVTVVDSPVLNALAAPGGEIVLYRRLVASPQTPEELAGVLAHEMQHVLQRHVMKALVRDLTLAALVAAVFGDVSGIGAFAVQGARTLTTLHYSRDAEAQADREGLTLLKAARIDPDGMVRFFQTLKKQAGGAEVPTYLSTHPETDERLAEMKALAAQLGTDLKSLPTALLADVNWSEVKNLCR